MPTDNPLSLAGRSVLVTGGNGGIGLGMAAACGRAGARIVLWGRDEAKNSSALARLSDDDIDARGFVCDVTDQTMVADVFARSIEAAGGRIDTVFANAGTTGRGVGFLDVDLDEWHRVLRTNLDGVFLTLQAAARHMVEAGGGSLIAVSSTSAIHGAANNEAYGTSKTAVLGLVRALAVSLARHRIRVNALVPGWTVTDLSGPAYEWDKFRDATTARTPVRRWADPAEMGAPAVFLADPTATFHTGDTVVVDGGYTVF
jgi:NAD(P)-dependent dehydrogenase (short-subunit alcohol dehydrogenase family)